MNEAPDQRFHSFGKFRLDSRTGELYREGLAVKLSPQPAKLLVLLVRSAGELVTREDIERELWSDGTFVDFEHGINKCVNQVRGALEDTTEEPLYIQTVARRGYRFCGKVERFEPPEPEGTPYPGLSSFLENDARFFFGREEEVEAVWNKIERRKLLALVGPSGAGKSSFLMAGIIPSRREGWHVELVTPGDSPLSSLPAPDAGHGSFLLLVDSFEELFTRNPREVQKEFSEHLSALSREKGVHVLLSLRDDFLFRCREQESLQEIFLDLTPLRPLSGPALRQALEKPAAVCGYRFEGELVEEMLREIGNLQSLALLASQLWEKRDRGKKILTRAAYQEIGGAGKALAESAEREARSIEPKEPAGLLVRPESPSARRGVPAVLVAVAILAIGIAISFLIRSNREPARPITRTAIALPAGDEFVVDRFSPAIAISPNGRHVAYVASHGGSRRLWLRALDELESRPVDGGENGRMPFFSPDSEWLGFLAGSGAELMKVPVRGGTPTRIAENLPSGRARGASWGADANVLIAPFNNVGLWRVPASGGVLEVVTVPNREKGELVHRDPEVLPGQKAAVFTLYSRGSSNSRDSSIAVVSLETGEVRILLEGGTTPRYSPSGHLVYGRAGALMAVSFDPAGLRVTGAPVAVVEGVRMSDHAEFSLSQEGALLYAPGKLQKGQRVVWVDRSGRTQPLIEAPDQYQSVEISPDGARLALTVDRGAHSVWVYDIERKAMTRVSSRDVDESPIWSPDGREVLFPSDRSGQWWFYRQIADGSEPAVQLTRSAQGPGSWSPDGALLIFNKPGPTGEQDLWWFGLREGGEPKVFLKTSANELHPRFSPDGRWVTYHSDESGRREIYVRPFPPAIGKWQVSTEGGVHAIWSPNGREIFYRDGDLMSLGSKMMVVDVEEEDHSKLRLSKPRVLFERRLRSYPFRQYDIAPDGQRFVMIEEVEPAAPVTELILVQNWNEGLERLVPRN